MRITCLLPLALLAPGHVFAADTVALDNSVFVERVTTDASGRQRVLLKEPAAVTSGDRLVFVLAYRNAGNRPTDRLVITNPLPAAVRFTGAGDDAPLVSVDGGHAWGPLAELTIRQPDGSRRPAQPSDVTHVRWTFRRPVPAGASGTLLFRGVVR